MDKALQIILASLISFAIGIGGTMYFDTPSEAEKKRNMTTESLSTAAENEKMKEKEAEIEMLKKNLEDAEAKLTGPIDYFKVITDLKNFNTALQSEINKNYETAKLQDPANKVKLHYIYSKLVSFQKTKTHWFKTTISTDGKNKVVSYFNYYSCSQPSNVDDTRKVATKDACFIMWNYALLNEKWVQSSFTSNVGSFLWNGDTPHLAVDIAPLEKLSEQTHILRFFLPIPDEDGKVVFLKYENGKIIWDNSASIDWVPSTQKEAEKFQKEINDLSQQ